LGKSIEIAFVKKVLSMLSETGFETLTAKYIPTAKNAQVREFWEKVGFTCVSSSEDGTKNFELKLADADLNIENHYHISVR